MSTHALFRFTIFSAWLILLCLSILTFSALAGTGGSTNDKASNAGFYFLDTVGPAPPGKYAAEGFRLGVHKGEPDIYQNKAGQDAGPGAKKNELLERSNLESHWRNTPNKQAIDHSLTWKLLVISFLAAALLIYWNRKLGRLNRELATANLALAKLSVTDDLTQLGNRSYFDQEFHKSFQWCQRHGVGFAVAMADADLFKSINDTYGHEAGDRCLKALADIMRHHFRRETDRLSRFGGEEFVIFTSYDNKAEIIKRLDDLRRAIESQGAVCAQTDVHLTISIGLATGIPSAEDSPQDFLRLADQSLYKAKQNGRNRLQHIDVGL